MSKNTAQCGVIIHTPRDALLSLASLHCRNIELSLDSGEPARIAFPNRTLTKRRCSGITTSQAVHGKPSLLSPTSADSVYYSQAIMAQ